MYILFNGLNEKVEGYYGENVADKLKEKNLKYAKQIKDHNNGDLLFETVKVMNPDYNLSAELVTIKEHKIELIKYKTQKLAIAKMMETLKSGEDTLINQVNACTTITQLKALKDER
jgi:hypothetical protein